MARSSTSNGVANKLTSVLHEMFDMIYTSPVMGEYEYRNTILMLHGLNIIDNQIHQHPLVLEQYNKLYMLPFLHEISRWYAVCGFCPYYVEDIPVEVEGEKQRIPVPRPYSPLEIQIMVETNPKTKRAEWYLVDVATQERIKHLLISSVVKQLCPISGRFFSECYAILPEFREYVYLKRVQIGIVIREANPTLYIRQEVPASTAVSDTNAKSLNEWKDAEKGADGFAIDTKRKESIELVNGEGVSALPRTYNTVTQQPRAVNHVDLNQVHHRLLNTISRILKIPNGNSRSGGGSAGMNGNGSGGGGGNSYHNKNEREINEEIAISIAACDTLRNDYYMAIQELWNHMFEHMGIEVHIPLRPLLDVDTVIKATEFGSISEHEAHVYVQHILGFHTTSKEMKQQLSSSRTSPSSSKKRSASSSKVKTKPKKQKTKSNNNSSNSSSDSSDKTEGEHSNKKKDETTPSKKKKKKTTTSSSKKKDDSDSDDSSDSSDDSEDEDKKSVSSSESKTKKKKTKKKKKRSNDDMDNKDDKQDKKKTDVSSKKKQKTSSSSEKKDK